MPIVKSVSSKSNLKQLTTADLPINPSQMVTNMYGPATSTTGQTSIVLPFSVSTANAQNFFLSVDGKLLSFGASSDYIFANIQPNGTSNQITLNQSLIAGLNIQAWYLGVIYPAYSATSLSTLQAQINNQSNFSTHSTSYTLTVTDASVEFNCSTGSLTATLPSAITIGAGKILKIKRIIDGSLSNTLSIATTSSQTIDGRASLSMIFQQGDYGHFVSDGSNWQTVALQESVNAQFGISTANLSATANTTIVWPIKNFDTHNAYNTSNGQYIVPVTGKYNIAASEIIFGTSNDYVKMFKNGSYLLTLTYNNPTNVALAFGSVLGSFIAGDILTWQITSSQTINYSATNYQAKISIARVGN